MEEMMIINDLFSKKSQRLGTGYPPQRGLVQTFKWRSQPMNSDNEARSPQTFLIHSAKWVVASLSRGLLQSALYPKENPETKRSASNRPRSGNVHYNQTNAKVVVAVGGIRMFLAAGKLERVRQLESSRHFRRNTRVCDNLIEIRISRVLFGA